jgi:hypothetical protein
MSTPAEVDRKNRMAELELRRKRLDEIKKRVGRGAGADDILREVTTLIGSGMCKKKALCVCEKKRNPRQDMP